MIHIKKKKQKTSMDEIPKQSVYSAKNSGPGTAEDIHF